MKWWHLQKSKKNYKSISMYKGQLNGNLKKTDWLIFCKIITYLLESWRVVDRYTEKHGRDSSSYLGTPPQHRGFHLEEGMEVQRA